MMLIRELLEAAPMKVDMQARADAELKVLSRKVQSMAKSKTKHVGHLEAGPTGTKDSSGRPLYYIGIESDSQLSDYIWDIVKASKFATPVEQEEHEGQFDWAADTYIKDSSSVTFRF